MHVNNVDRKMTGINYDRFGLVLCTVLFPTTLPTNQANCANLVLYNQVSIFETDTKQIRQEILFKATSRVDHPLEFHNLYPKQAVNQIHKGQEL